MTSESHNVVRRVGAHEQARRENRSREGGREGGSEGGSLQTTTLHFGSEIYTALEGKNSESVCRDFEVWAYNSGKWLE